jgi:antitoxin component of RelBE/YafQ-DinJ toxin-antitoxin module
MNTTILLKTNKALKDEASRVAKELGVPLTTVVNAYLRQFVRDREIHISMEPLLSTKKLKELFALSDDMDNGKNIGIKTNKPDELFKHLGI